MTPAPPVTSTPETPAPSGLASNGSSAALPGLTYEDTTGKYRFNYDPSWVVRSQQRPTDVVIFGSPGDPSKAVSNVSIGILGAPSGISVNTYAHQDLAFIRLIPGAKLLSARGERLGGQPAYSLEYLLRINGRTVKSLQLTTLSNGQVYSVIYSSSTEHFQADLIQAGLIARSFAFTTPPEQPRFHVSPPANGKEVFPIPVRFG